MPTQAIEGTGITAFPFVGGNSHSGHAPVHYPYPLDVATNVSCSVDPNGEYIAVRYKLDVFGTNFYLYDCYDLAGFYAHGFNATQLLNQFPEVPGDSIDYGPWSFQGFAVAGQYLYTVAQDGTPNGPGRFRSYNMNAPDPQPGDFKELVNVLASSATPGEFEGQCIFPAGASTSVGYMVTSGGHLSGGTIPYKFNLHTRG